MGRAPALRESVAGAEAKRRARASRDGECTLRLALKLYGGGSSVRAAQTGGVGRQILLGRGLSVDAEGPNGRRAPVARTDDIRAVLPPGPRMELPVQDEARG